MAQNDLSSILNTLIPILLIIIPIIFIWWKFSEPLKKFWDLIAGAFSSGKEKTYQTYTNSKEIIYDI